jgi:hypothetical protein
MIPTSWYNFITNLLVNYIRGAVTGLNEMAQLTPCARITRRGIAVRTIRFARGGVLDSQLIAFDAHARDRCLCLKCNFWGV